MLFVPLVNETGGYFGKEAEKLFETMINRIASIYKIEPSSVDKFWAARFSIAFQCAQADALMAKGRMIARSLSKDQDSGGAFIRDIINDDRFSMGGGLGLTVRHNDFC